MQASDASIVKQARHFLQPSGCGGTNIIPGRRKEQTPYRAELGGGT
jgi:hypothetical protein